MGNSCMSRESGNVTTDVKQQGDAAVNAVYRLVDMSGGGELVELTKKGKRSKDFSELDARILSDDFRSLLYNNGNGKRVPLIDVLNYRDDKDYKKEAMGPKNKLKKAMSKTEIETNHGNGEVSYLFKKKDQQYKEVCWRIDKRGTVGETILHLCFLNSSTLHADLAKRLIHHYPHLIYDFYMGDMYFGETVLHMAIVNEDPAMVKFLLDKGADVHQRCCGSFFCPADQKQSRSAAHDREWIAVCRETNYEGYTYWGESPLSFAACLEQEECVRLLVAKGADLNFQDANGNTALHMLVIYDKKDMFSLLHNLGSRLDIKNRQELTPLTLAAKLARKEMYEVILEIEREDYWIYGNVTCAGYPLEHIDTISETGEINKNSALSLIVYGEKEGHLEMMDGLVVYLLEEKWRTFVRFRFYRRLGIFLAYFIMFVLAFTWRPGTDLHPTESTTIVTNNNVSSEEKTKVINPCYLMEPYRGEDIARFVLEAIIYLGSCLYILLAMKESYHQGPKIFLTTLKGAPTKALFLCSCLFVILMLPGRAACAYQYEDIMGVLAILCTAPYFLFFCRGFRIVGPFVVMIYNMIRGDLLRFFMIYAVFVIGFSQAFYLAFLGVKKHTVFTSPLETMLALLTMATGEFEDFVEEFPNSRHFDLLNVVFFVYMIMVTLLLVNMLIAMMGNTYQLINNTQKEWFRQWANIVLVIEQSVTTAHRKEKQQAYSHPRSNDETKRVLVSRWHQTDNYHNLCVRLKVNNNKANKIYCTAAERSQRFRDNLKLNKQKYEEMKEKDRIRNKLARASMTEKQRERTKILNRERQRRYRERNKTERKPTKIRTVLTRTERVKKQEYWRQKQRESRAKRSSQKIRRKREKDMQYLQMKKEKAVDTVQSSEGPDHNESERCESHSALRKAVQRARQGLPKNADQYANTIKYLLQKSTPRKMLAMSRQKIFEGTPAAKRKLFLWEKVSESLRESIKKRKQTKKDVLASMKILKKYRLAKATSIMCGVLPSTLSRATEESERTKRKDAVSTEVKDKIQEFYSRPDVSTEIPDKKSVKRGVERRALDRPLKAIYEDFMNENPDVSIAFSTFAANRPSNVNTTKQQPWYSCLCDVCTNVDLKLRALNLTCSKLQMSHLQIADRYVAMNLSLCNKGEKKFHNKKCVRRDCLSCSADRLYSHLDQLLQNHSDEEVEYTKWEKTPGVSKQGKPTTRVMMKKKKSSVRLLVRELVEELSPLTGHLFNARWQQVQFTHLTKNLPNNWVILNLDFAENYACVSQMEIQSAHWAINQVTVHPIVAYYNCTKSQCQGVVQESMLFISDDLIHDYHAVTAFLKSANKHLTEKQNVIIEKEIHFSDGCASQYKSHGPFTDISYAIHDHGFPIERHFYGSRHGKGPSDGAGAVLKSAAKRAVKGQQFVINTPLDLYQFARQTLEKQDTEAQHLHSKRSVFFLPSHDISRNRPDREAKTVKGTRAFHCVKTVLSGQPREILTRDQSCFCSSCISGEGSCENGEHCGPWSHVQLQDRTKGKQATGQVKSRNERGEANENLNRQKGQRTKIKEKTKVNPNRLNESKDQEKSSAKTKTTGQKEDTDNSNQQERRETDPFLPQIERSSEVEPKCAEFGQEILSLELPLFDELQPYSLDLTSYLDSKMMDVSSVQEVEPELNDKLTSPNDLSQRYSTGSHVLIKHGSQFLPAVVSDVQDGITWVLYYKQKANSAGWLLQESTKYSLLEQDVESVLDPPELVVEGGSRFYYKFPSFQN